MPMPLWFCEDEFDWICATQQSLINEYIHRFLGLQVGLGVAHLSTTNDFAGPGTPNSATYLASFLF